MEESFLKVLSASEDSHVSEREERFDSDGEEEECDSDFLHGNVRSSTGPQIVRAKGSSKANIMLLLVHPTSKIAFCSIQRRCASQSILIVLVAYNTSISKASRLPPSASSSSSILPSLILTINNFDLKGEPGQTRYHRVIKNLPSMLC